MGPVVDAAEHFARLLRHAAAPGSPEESGERGDSGEESLFVRIVRAAAMSLPVDGIALTLHTTPSQLQLMSASPGIAARIEDLQMTLGEGPTLDAYASYGPVLIADLTLLEGGRWPILEAALSTEDVGFLGALPLQLGAIRLGVLSVYRHEPGLLEPDDLAAAFEVADAVTTLLLMSGESVPSDELLAQWVDGSANTNEINQATGMVIAQLGVAAEEAYVRLRSTAFALGRPLSSIALDVVERRLRLDVAGY